jgi:hypothetical protein
MTAKLELKTILAAIDLGSKESWDEFSDEEKKSVAFFLLNRYASNVKTNNQDLAEHYLILVNEFVNKNFYLMSKHPKLMWQLMCACSHDSKKIHFHEWMALKRKADPGSKKTQFLQTIYPNAKLDDLEILSKMMDTKQVKQLAKDHGYTDKQINDLKL